MLVIGEFSSMCSPSSWRLNEGKVNMCCLGGGNIVNLPLCYKVNNAIMTQNMYSLKIQYTFLLTSSRQHDAHAHESFRWALNAGSMHLWVSWLHTVESMLSAQQPSCHRQLPVTIYCQEVMGGAPNHVTTATANHRGHMIGNTSSHLSEPFKELVGVSAKV